MILLADDQGRRYTTFSRHSTCAPGEVVAVRGTLRPWQAARNPGGLSERALAEERGWFAAIDAPRLNRLAEGDPRDPRFWPARFRLWASSVIDRRLPADEAAVCTGMLWGDHHNLTFDDAAAFSATGTSHLLVTAGLHLGLLAAAIRLTLRLLTVERGLAVLLTLLAIWSGCALSGAHLPSVRAAIMLSLWLGAESLGTTTDPRRALGIAFLLVLTADPSSVGDISFFLSFSCVFAILHLTAPLEDAMKQRVRPPALAKLLAAGLAAQLGTWALIAAQFHLISFIAPLVNALAIPCALAALIFVPIFLCLPAWGAAPLHLLLHCLLLIVRTSAHLPCAAVTAGSPPLWSLCLYEGALILACGLVGPRGQSCLLRTSHALRELLPRRAREGILTFALSPRLRALAAATLLFAASGEVLAPLLLATHRFRVTVLDVGQGDGIVVETPNGHTLLIDTGGRLELHARDSAESPSERAAERVLLPFLAYRGITRIDLMLLTHPHGDHVGGAAPVLRSLPVTLFLDSGQSYPGLAYRDALREARRAKVRRIVARSGDRITLDDGVELRILAPSPPLFTGGRNDINENSIVALLTYRRLRILLTGDAGFQAEQRLLRSGADLHAEILKVGHHGSAFASSSAFLRAVRPRVAVISVGQHNLFHHPARATLIRLAALGIRVFRTDQCGAIMLDADGAVRTMLPCKDSAPIADTGESENEE